MIDSGNCTAFYNFTYKSELIRISKKLNLHKGHVDTFAIQSKLSAMLQDKKQKQTRKHVIFN